MRTLTNFLAIGIALLFVSACSKSDAVIGKWIDDKSGLYIEFNGDGTCLTRLAGEDGKPSEGQVGEWHRMQDGKVLVSWKDNAPAELNISASNDSTLLSLVST